MKNKKVISSKNLPVRFPFWQSLTVILLCDYYNLSDWVRGVIAGVFLIWWVMAIVFWLIEEKVDIF